MKPVDRSEILPLGDYEAIRDRFRGRVIADKQQRRANVGDSMSVVFENHDTVLLQIQEMLRTERITREDAILHEITTYNEIVPGDDQLSMTLFIEVDDKPSREALLAACAGMESHVFIEIDGQRHAATAASRDGAEPGRTTAVQYYLIDLGDAAPALRDGAVARMAVVVDHPGYSQRADLDATTIAQLSGDLRWSS
jgi:hypothetical protein